MSTLEPQEPGPPLLDELAVLHGRRRTVTALGGGLTNRTYRVTTDDGGDYVVRVPSTGSGLLAVDRAAERHNTRAAWVAGAGPSVVEALPERGVLVVEHVPGRTLTADDVRDPGTIPRIAAAVRALHAGPEFTGHFDLRAIRLRYLAIVREHGCRLPTDYLDLAPRAEVLEDAVRSGGERLVPCHNDLSAANLIDDGTRIWLVDFEYGAMNEASFELGNLASESGLDDDQTRALVAAYWALDPAGDAVDPALARVQAWSLLARHAWTLWASIQDAMSTIPFDFWSWGTAQYDSVRTDLLGPRYDGLLAALERTPA